MANPTLPAVTMIKGPFAVAPRGYRGAAGTTIGAAGYTDWSGHGIPAMAIEVPTTWANNIMEVQSPGNTGLVAPTVLWAIDSAGGLVMSGATKVSRRVARFPLTAAQLNSMFTTPITIVPAPGAGIALLVRQIHVEFDLTATQFAAGGVIHFYYHGQTTEIMAQVIAAATLIGSASPSQVLMILEPVQTAGGSVVTSAVGIDITNVTQLFTTGTGTAVITVWYDYLTLG